MYRHERFEKLLKTNMLNVEYVEKYFDSNSASLLTAFEAQRASFDKAEEVRYSTRNFPDVFTFCKSIGVKFSLQTKLRNTFDLTL